MPLETYGRVFKVLLCRVAVDVDAPELTAYHALSQSLEISMSQELVLEVNATIVYAIVQLDSKQPRKVIVAINQSSSAESVPKPMSA